MAMRLTKISHFCSVIWFLCLPYSFLSEVSALSPNRSSILDESIFNFSIEFLQNMTEDPAFRNKSNIILSPRNIFRVSLLAFLGSKGQTESELRDVLSLKNLTYEDIMKGFLLDKLNDTSVQEIEKLYYQDNITIKPEYLALFPEKIEGVDFIDDPVNVTEKINNWVSKETKGKIPKLLSNPLASDTLVALLGALYFGNKWSTVFEEKNTRQRDFTYENGITTKTCIMKESLVALYAESKELESQVISLDFDDNKYGFLIMLPDSSTNQTVENVLQKLNSDIFWTVLESLEETYIDLFLPRFKAEMELDLIPIFTRLGAGKMFSGQANFSKMVDKVLDVGEFIHKATVDVTEGGTVAAAATAMSFTFLSTGGSGFPVVVDHPFIYMIYNKNTGTPVFTGVTFHPQDSKCSKPDFYELQIPTLLDTPIRNFSINTLKVLNEIRQKENKTSANLFISPRNMFQGIILLFFGSIGFTERAYRRLLSLGDLDYTKIYNAYESMKFIEDPYLLEAERLYYSNDLGMKEEYLLKFLMETEEVDFANNSLKVTEEINKWVFDQTHGQINKILDKPLEANTELAVVAAVYFEEGWGSKFRASWTSKMPFYLSSGEEIMVDTMWIKEYLYYTESTKLRCEVVSKGYASMVYSFLVLLPNTTAGQTVEGLITELNLETFMEIFQSFRHLEVELELPKFEIEDSLDMKEMMSKLGDFPFEAIPGHYSRMCDKMLTLTDTKHKTSILLNETGTIAAAATVLGARARSLSPYITVSVNHPFVFMIYNNVLRTPIFVGILNDPRSKML